MASTGPRIGQFYSCAEQSRMHGGDSRSTLPDSKGKVTLIRFRLDRNPDGPHIIDHGPPKTPASRTHERVEMLRRQIDPLPVYKRVSGGTWEYLGRYRVQGITDGGQAAFERSKIRGRPTRYVIRLEEDI
jgi:hypothetical protein